MAARWPKESVTDGPKAAARRRPLSLPRADATLRAQEEGAPCRRTILPSRAHLANPALHQPIKLGEREARDLLVDRDSGGRHARIDCSRLISTTWEARRLNITRTCWTPCSVRSSPGAVGPGAHSAIKCSGT